MNLKEKYNLYSIDKGTILFRQALDTNYDDEMFFGFSVFATYSAFNNSDEIQIWETQININAFLMLNDYSKINRKKSSIVDIYNNFFPENQFDKDADVYLKNNIEKRTKLTEKLKSKGIYNWVSSVENKFEMELFLFHSKEHNSDCIKYIKSIETKSNSMSDVDTFDILKIRSNK